MLSRWNPFETGSVHRHSMREQASKTLWLVPVRCRPQYSVGPSHSPAPCPRGAPAAAVRPGNDDHQRRFKQANVGCAGTCPRPYLRGRPSRSKNGQWAGDQSNCFVRPGGRHSSAASKPNVQGEKEKKKKEATASDGRPAQELNAGQKSQSTIACAIKAFIPCCR